MNSLRFSIRYFAYFILLLAIEIYIPLCIRDVFIRPYGGDILVLVMIYSVIKSFFNTPFFITAVSVLIFACMVEVSQSFHLVNLLGLEHSKIAILVLGTSFSYRDIFCYAAGILFVIIIDNLAIALKQF